MRAGSPGFGETVTVLHMVDPEHDAWGDLKPGTGIVVEIEVPGCAVAPLKQGEDASPDGAVVLDGWTLYMPFGSAIGADDSVIVRDLEYHVDGVPGVWSNPYNLGYPRGVEVVVRRS